MPNLKREPRHTLCINCLMMKGQAREVTSAYGDQYACSTFGGCASVYTVGYLDHVSGAVERLMASIGKATIIRKGSAEEEAEQKMAVERGRKIRLE